MLYGRRTLSFRALRDVCCGRAEVREWFEDLLEIMESLRAEREKITGLSDDRLFVEIVLTARGKGSGVPVELRFWGVFWLAEGKIARRQVFFWIGDEALEAVGLRE
jgi:ketosteroid isomerase-like protein